MQDLKEKLAELRLKEQKVIDDCVAFQKKRGVSERQALRDYMERRERIGMGGELWKR